MWAPGCPVIARSPIGPPSLAMNLALCWRESPAGTGKAKGGLPERSDLAGAHAPASLEGAEQMNGIKPEGSTPLAKDDVVRFDLHVSAPDAASALGPLSTHPDTSATPATCAP